MRNLLLNNKLESQCQKKGEMANIYSLIDDTVGRQQLYGSDFEKYGNINVRGANNISIYQEEKILEETMKQEKVINIGNNNQISSPILIAETIENSFNTVEKSNVNDNLKAKLNELLKAIAEISQQVTHPEDMETVEILT